MTDTIERLNAALEGRYRIDREVGEGGMATVFLADDLRHERKVALKVLKPELAAVVGAERFLAEIKTTANLQHPHILPLFDSGEADGFLFYVMPYVDGETLRERIDRDRQLPVDEAVRIATAVANALQTAHEQGIVHRDIKPANVLLSRGEPLVADFGIALAVGAAGGSRLTETGLSVGTPFYMSPEQATGDQALGPASDTYALACVLYELLVGDPPYVGSTAQAVLGKIIQGDPVSATSLRKSIPPHVDAAIRKALEKLPADRFTAANDFARALSDPGFRHGRAVGVEVGLGPRGWKRAAIGFAATTAALAMSFAWAATQPEPAQRVLRHGMMIPEELSLWSQFGPQMAISADGNSIAFASFEDGASGVRLLERDQLDARMLDGTEGAWNPFFSPDGTRVGFVTGGRQLKIVSLGGEPPLTVVDSGLVRGGGSWGQDGYIYFTEGTSSGSDVSGLGRVLGTGGPIESVTTLDTTRNELAHTFPDALPNGRGVLFVLSRERLYDSETMEIAVADVETGEHRVLLQGLMARWSPTGHVLVVRDDGALLAAPFDPERLELEGPAVPLLDGVAAERLGGNTGLPSSAELAISDNGTLIYSASSGVEETGRWAPVWVTREGAVQEIDPDLRRGNFQFPSLSPDGGRLALTLSEQTGTHIWIKQLDRGPMSKLSLQGNVNRRAAWTPDGRTVTFASDRGADSDLYTRLADGSAQAALLLDEEGPINEVTYSPDGEWVTYRLNNDLFARRLGGDEAIRITESTFAMLGPQISPDGRWIAYASNETGRFEVYVHPFPNVADGRWIVSTSGGFTPQWAHSGQELFYVGVDNRMMVVPVLEGTTFVYDDPRPLFPLVGFRTNAAHAEYDVAPEDDRFLMLQGLDASGRVIVVDNFFEEMLGRLRN